jgi:hypothetical protein
MELTYRLPNTASLAELYNRYTDGGEIGMYSKLPSELLATWTGTQWIETEYTLETRPTSAAPAFQVDVSDAIITPDTAPTVPQLAGIPVLKYPKDPAATLAELIDRYTDGGEYGWYAFVFEARTFAWWNHDEEEWQLLTAGGEVQGEAVTTADILTNMGGGIQFGLITTNTLIPRGTSLEAIVRQATIGQVLPTVAIAVLGDIPYNASSAVDRFLTIQMLSISNNAGGTIVQQDLYYKRPAAILWNKIEGITATQNSYQHNIRTLLADDNTSAIMYKLEATDSNGDMATDSTSISPQSMAAPSTNIAGTSITRERGNLSLNIAGNITQAAQNGVSISNYKLQYNKNNEGWISFVDVDTDTPSMPIAINTTHNDVALVDANTIAYRLQVTTESPAGQTTTTIALSTLTFVYKNAFGYLATQAPTLAQLLDMGNTALSNGRAKTLVATAPAAHYSYYIYAASAGDINSIIMDGAAPVLGAFTKLADITGTNSFGASVTYRVYKSNAPAAFTNNQLTIS